MSRHIMSMPRHASLGFLTGCFWCLTFCCIDLLFQNPLVSFLASFFSFCYILTLALIHIYYEPYIHSHFEFHIFEMEADYSNWFLKDKLHLDAKMYVFVPNSFVVIFCLVLINLMRKKGINCLQYFQGIIQFHIIWWMGQWRGSGVPTLKTMDMILKIFVPVANTFRHWLISDLWTTTIKKKS